MGKTHSHSFNIALIAIIIYIIVILTIIITKPEFIYDHKNNKFKDFGGGENQTYMPLMLFGIVASILIYYLVVALAGYCGSRSKYLIKYS